jgi:hypothetical protein
MKKLFIDLGHSKRFPGARGVKDEVAWTREIAAHVTAQGWDISWVPESFPWTLTSNQELIRRIGWINARAKDGDWLLSIHGNAAVNPAVRGVTTCYMGGSEWARKKAVALSKSVSAATGVPVWGGGAFDDRTARFGRIGMCRDTRPPALLVEAGFVTNREDMAVRPEAYAKGISDFFMAQ